MEMKTPPFGSKPLVAETCTARGTDLSRDSGADHKSKNNDHNTIITICIPAFMGKQSSTSVCSKSAWRLKWISAKAPAKLQLTPDSVSDLEQVGTQRTIKQPGYTCSNLYPEYSPSTCGFVICEFPEPQMVSSH